MWACSLCCAFEKVYTSSAVKIVRLLGTKQCWMQLDFHHEEIVLFGVIKAHQRLTFCYATLWSCAGYMSQGHVVLACQSAHSR